MFLVKEQCVHLVHSSKGLTRSLIKSLSQPCPQPPRNFQEPVCVKELFLPPTFFFFFCHPQILILYFFKAEFRFTR